MRDALGHVMVTGAERLGGIALVVRFEVAASDAVRTLESLRAVMRITEGESIPSGDELFGHLHVTLAHDGPDERVEIPKVPG
ncbi:MAG: hypothetical protein H6722_31180 [Sandaracinus sp.]|nr:hypothetical protein [Sandaracinus sp.]MCB9621482.1 hypothetical protein [Sandaracinus sp.]MCB9622809.1 hypothetical protein [Sandaracinus sp.]